MKLVARTAPPVSPAVALVVMALLALAAGGSGQSAPLQVGPESPGGGLWEPGRDDEAHEVMAAERVEALADESAGHWSAARVHWSNAMRFAPHDVEAILGHARTLIADGRPWDAALFLDAQVRGGVADPDLLHAAGDASMAAEDLEQAAGYYRRAVEMAPAEARFRAAHAWALHLGARHAEVVDVLASVPLAELGTPILRALASASLEADRPVRAVEALQVLLAEDPSDAVARLDLARAALLAGRDADAYEALGAYLAEHPDDHAAWTLLGHVRLRVGQPDLALACYVAAVERGADAHRLRPLMDRARLSVEVFGAPPAETGR